MSIPLNNIVKINPSVLGVGNNGNNLYGLMLTKDGNLPSSQLTSVNNTDQIITLFGGNSVEYTLGDVYFSGFTNSPRVAQQLYIAPYRSGETSATLLGANISKYADNIATVQGFSGTFSITIDGTVKTNNDIDLSSATSLSDVASILTHDLGCPVVYSPSTNGLIVSSPTSGTSSSVGYATGTLADDLRLSQAQGAQQSKATANQTLTELLNTLRKSNLAFCSVFLAWTPTDDERMELAKWANSTKNDVCVIINDADEIAIEAVNENNKTSFAEKVSAAGYDGVVSVYNNLELCAFIAGYPGAWDLTAADGRFTAAFRRSSLLQVNVTEQDAAINLKAKGYNFYGEWASATSNFTFMYDGKISGLYVWLDSWFCQVWIRRQFQYCFIMTLLAKGQIPYNTDGKGILTTAIKPAIDQYLNFGAIRPGISLADEQVQQLKQAGLNQSQINNITTVGYYLSVDMGRVTAQTRVQRGSPPISFWYTDGQSVQQINMNSIEIQ